MVRINDDRQSFRGFAMLGGNAPFLGWFRLKQLTFSKPIKPLFAAAFLITSHLRFVATSRTPLSLLWRLDAPTPWVSCRPLILLIFAVMPARSEIPHVEKSPAPEWVTPLSLNATPGEPPADVRDGKWFLLRDEQVNVGNQTEYWHI